MNELIETIFTDFEVDAKKIPVSFLKYEGKGNAYITYQLESRDNVFAGDNEILNYVDYYDFNVYTKGNYFKIVESVKEKLKENDFMWIPSRSSGDMYEDDTGFFHVTLSFSYVREEK